MALSSSVEKVLRLVEEKTGLPVHVEPDSSLPANLLAKVTAARGAVPFHRVGYQPHASQAPDYLIVFQCGFILRRYAAPVEKRLDFAPTDQAEKVVREWVRTNPKKPNMSWAHPANRGSSKSSGRTNPWTDLELRVMDSFYLHQAMTVAKRAKRGNTLLSRAGWTKDPGPAFPTSSWTDHSHARLAAGDGQVHGAP